ncbi:recombinase family protein [Bradyrhizobium sp. IC3069]|nr:recombinase family protein [Bradyrhizobium sp. IC4059]MCA1393398.1 recombinase family protein [Bradyrhizobium sp. IC3123]MCA1436165.1 recombinase family protein [Bradyrhizobium sp. BRP20]MCA1522795.1 recombinase family protein [Bradyrhizobium sp. IC3069]MCA1532227.1 recombinase family protein [Bradyrhizobium sp. NBAIM03]
MKQPAPRTVQEARANARAAELAPLIEALQKSGATSLGALAKKLNETCVPTPAGQGRWSATQVWRILKRLRQISHGP